MISNAWNLDISELDNDSNLNTVCLTASDILGSSSRFPHLIVFGL